MVDNGWPIECERVSMKDRDGKTCRPGYYFLAESGYDEAVAACLDWEKCSG